MQITEGRIEHAKRSLMIRITRKIAIDNNIPIEDALKQFINTKTFELLMDTDSFLYLETPEYVYNLLKCEYNNDIEGWLKL